MAAPDHDDATVAAVFRAALSLGIAAPADLVPWADEQIAARDRPAEWIIDLSMGAAAPADEACEHLRDVAAGVTPGTVFRLLVGLIDGADQWDIAQARRAASWLWKTAQRYADDVVSSEACGIDWAFERAAARSRKGGTPRLVERLAKFVNRLADPAARAWLPGVRVRFA